MEETVSKDISYLAKAQSLINIVEIAGDYREGLSDGEPSSY